MSRKQRIQDVLSQEIKPDTLIIEDESHKHSVPKDGESHFKVIAVAKHFNTMTRIARHREINSLLAAEFKMGLHALSLHLYTPDEWIKKNPDLIKSPPCQKKAPLSRS